MKNQKSPIMSVYLNVIIPGLGLAYLDRWGHAAFVFVWTTLRFIVGIIFIAAVPFARYLGNWGYAIQLVLLFAWWAYLMYDTCMMPYEMAIGQKRNTVVQPAQGHDHRSDDDPAIGTGDEPGA